MAETRQLIAALADGAFHSGEALARNLGVSRAAVWKRIKRVSAETGLEVDAVRGRGYRLREPIELLDADRLTATLPGNLCDRLWVLSSVDSTNAFLARQPRPTVGRAHVCLAEHQQAGRGRRGRQWQAGYASSLLLSVAWRFDLPLAELSALSLAVGVAVAESLGALGVSGHGLKWPNDVLVGERKLAGILVEASGEAGGPTLAIIGLGLNVRMSAVGAANIDQPWADLAGLGLPGLSRNRVAEIIAKGVLDACAEFAHAGLAPFLERWAAYDRLLGRTVRLLGPNSVVSGRYLGLDGNGALRLAGQDGERTYHAGEISLREGRGLG